MSVTICLPQLVKPSSQAVPQVSGTMATPGIAMRIRIALKGTNSG